LACAETLHGIARIKLLIPLMGKDQAIRLSALTGTLLAFAICLVLVPGIGPYDLFATRWGYKPIPGATAYNMAKAALDQLAKTAAVELSEFRIRVNLVHPGWTDTPGERKFFYEDELQEHGSNLPWGRLAKPEDIAHGVVFLCDPRSDYITGATLSIDGGIVLPYQEMFRIRNRPKTT
jgi:NAD(P)-dependent dehydrogenase (short-subunit alcohol dehydrogenase family)